MKKYTKIILNLVTDDIKEHRYASGDDWWDPIYVKKDDSLHFVTVTADMGNRDYNFLVLLHALVEQYLCFSHGISDKEVTGFDTGLGANLKDPGSSKKAPYHKEHEVANEVERIVSRALNVVWPDYDKQYDKIVKKWKPKKN